jgi:hypothetical protein
MALQPVSDDGLAANHTSAKPITDTGTAYLGASRAVAVCLSRKRERRLPSQIKASACTTIWAGYASCILHGDLLEAGRSSDLR